MFPGCGTRTHSYVHRVGQQTQAQIRTTHTVYFYVESASSGVLHWVICCHSIMEYGYEYGLMEFITLWTSGVKKTTECLFLIFANANANVSFFNIRTCECE